MLLKGIGGEVRKMEFGTEVFLDKISSCSEPSELVELLRGIEFELNLVDSVDREEKGPFRLLTPSGAS